MSIQLNWPLGPNTFSGSDVTITLNSSNNTYLIEDNKSNKSTGVLTQAGDKLTFQTQETGSTTVLQTITVKVA